MWVKVKLSVIKALGVGEITIFLWKTTKEKKRDGKKIVNLVKKHDAVNTEEARKSTKAPKKCLWNMAIVILCSDESSVTAQRRPHWKKLL